MPNKKGEQVLVFRIFQKRLQDLGSQERMANGGQEGKATYLSPRLCLSISSVPTHSLGTRLGSLSTRTEVGSVLEEQQLPGPLSRHGRKAGLSLGNPTWLGKTFIKILCFRN